MVTETVIEKGYKNTDIGVIPDDWEVKRLGSATDIIMGQSPAGHSYNREGFGIPLINGPTEFTKKYPIKIQWTSQPTKTCKNGDVLLCVRGSSTGRINISDDLYCIGRGVAAIRAKSEFDQGFITFQLDSAVRGILSLTTGSTFPNIDGKAIRAIEFPAPPTKTEQTVIAITLSDVNALISKLENLISKKKDIKQGAMQELLTGKKRLPGFSDKWETKLFGSLIEINKGQQLNKSELTATGEYPDWNGGIEPSGYTTKWNMVENTITISEGGNSCGFVNYCKQKFWCGGHCYALKITSANLDKLFLYQLLKLTEKTIMSLRIGSGLPNIQKKNLNEFELFIPKDSKEQTAIAQLLSDMDWEIAHLEQKLDKYKMLKQGMMQELLTGRTRLL